MRRVHLIPILFLVAGCLGQPQLPAPQVDIEPAVPDPEDDLVLVLEDISEGDDRPDLVWDIVWSVDGAAADELADAREIAAAHTQVGETWTATVRFQLDGELGPAAEASVVISSDGDDDDVVDDDDSGDDDDSSGDDDDVQPDDDDAVEAPGPISRLCAAAGTSAGSTYSATTCTGPLTPVQGVSTSSTYTLSVTSFRVLDAPSAR